MRKDRSGCLEVANTRGDRAATYGLAAYFYASNLKRVWRVAEALEYGMVGINAGRMSSEAAPFREMKQSSIGREGSRHGLNDYLEMKYLCMGGI
jgi:succinate-semialdehyde dehydrogenase/glutarate-semialdehyde dehydrogenase